MSYRIKVQCHKCGVIDPVNSTVPKEEFLRGYKNRGKHYLCVTCWTENDYNEKQNMPFCTKRCKHCYGIIISGAKMYNIIKSIEIDTITHERVEPKNLYYCSKKCLDRALVLYSVPKYGYCISYNKVEIPLTRFELLDV